MCECLWHWFITERAGKLINLGPVYTVPVQLLNRNRRCYGSAYRLHCYELSMTLLAPVTGTLSVPAKEA